MKMHWCTPLLALAVPALSQPIHIPSWLVGEPFAPTRPASSPSVDATPAPQTSASAVPSAVASAAPSVDTSSTDASSADSSSAGIVKTQSATAGSKRAIWLWNTEIIQDDSEVQTFLDKMTNKDHPFDTVLALIDRDMGMAPWQSFVKKCNAAGLKVEGLMGDKQWIVGKTSEDGPTLEHELAWIKQYQASASSDAKLAGIHLDVEPWALDDFDANKAHHVSALVDIVSQVKEVTSSLNLPLGADLPFWANTVPCQDSTLDTCLLDSLDYVTFMTYRNTAKSLLGIADPVLKAVKAIDSSKPVWLSVETSSECNDVGLISYAGKSLGNMLGDLLTISTTAKKTSNNFAGVAVHSYKDFLTMSK